MTKGERIKHLREQYKMTQDELAKSLDTTKQTIYKYENDIITNIPSDKIMLLSKLLRTTPAYIMGWTDDPAVPDQEKQTDPAEEHLLSTFRQLNDEGQEKLVDYADDLAASGRYKKGNSFEVVEEEA